MSSESFHSQATHLRKKILVVEDDRSHRNFMDSILSSMNFETDQAENGLIALSKLKNGQHYDLVILDWDMPEMSGLETIRLIRERETQQGCKHLKVIAFTGKNEQGDKEMCLAAGMDAYLPKDVFLPRWRQTLLEKLNTFLDEPMPALPKNDSPLLDLSTNMNNFDLDLFEESVFEHTANLLKDELEIAIDEFCEDAIAYIRKIETGLKEQELEKIARGSHPLKSNSRGFGLLSVSQIAESINYLAEHCEPTESSFEELLDLTLQLKEAFWIGEKRIRQELEFRK